MLSIAECLKKSELLKACSDSPQVDVEVLLAWVLEKNRTYLYTWPETTLTCAQQRAFDSSLSRRLAGEPIAYITGQKEFWSLSLAVHPSTLIPRPDTETLVEVALGKLPQNTTDVLDLGTGTGAVALALACECPHHRVTAVDNNPEAVLLAESNAQRLGLNNVTCLQSDWFSQLKHTAFAVIVSNPPYIAEDDHHLTEGDVVYEPLSALVSAQQGFADLAFIICDSRQHLHPGGWLLLEHGYQQAETVRHFFMQHGYTDIETVKDYGGHERVSLGRWPESA